MERKDFTTVGDVLRECLERSRMQDRLEEVRACGMWEAVLGTHIASLCHRPEISKGLMTVRVGDASLRQELHMRRGAIARAINDIMGKDVVREIRLTS